MKLYHGTSLSTWEAIQEEGVLWGRRHPIKDKDGKLHTPDRCTYLITDCLEASQYGEVVLEIEYTPGTFIDDYSPGKLNIKVMEPIPIELVSRFY